MIYGGIRMLHVMITESLYNKCIKGILFTNLSNNKLKLGNKLLFNDNGFKLYDKCKKQSNKHKFIQTYYY